MLLFQLIDFDKQDYFSMLQTKTSREALEEAAIIISDVFSLDSWSELWSLYSSYKLNKE